MSAISLRNDLKPRRISSLQEQDKFLLSCAAYSFHVQERGLPRISLSAVLAVRVEPALNHA